MRGGGIGGGRDRKGGREGKVGGGGGWSVYDDGSVAPGCGEEQDLEMVVVSPCR